MVEFLVLQLRLCGEGNMKLGHSTDIKKVSWLDLITYLLSLEYSQSVIQKLVTIVELCLSHGVIKIIKPNRNPCSN